MADIQVKELKNSFFNRQVSRRGALKILGTTAALAGVPGLGLANELAAPARKKKAEHYFPFN